MVVACSAPPLSLPWAIMHLPWVMACVLAGAALVYFVLLPTVTVCGGPPATLIVMVWPATDATVPCTGACLPGLVVGVPDVGSLPCGQLPLTAWLTRTDAAVWSPSLDRTLTQLPAVTSVKAAGVTSVTLVESVKFTVAVPLCWVTWAALPETDATSPLTFASPWGGVDGEVADAGGEVVVGDATTVLGDVVGLDVLDEPQAATDSAAAPASANVAQRVTNNFPPRIVGDSPTIRFTRRSCADSVY